MGFGQTIGTVVRKEVGPRGSYPVQQHTVYRRYCTYCFRRLMYEQDNNITSIGTYTSACSQPKSKSKKGVEHHDDVKLLWFITQRCPVWTISSPESSCHYLAAFARYRTRGLPMHMVVVLPYVPRLPHIASHTPTNSIPIRLSPDRRSSVDLMVQHLWCQCFLLQGTIAITTHDGPKNPYIALSSRIILCSDYCVRQ